MVKEWKRDFSNGPDEVIYGNAAGSSRIAKELEDDERLEMDNYKRISISKKQIKERNKKLNKIERGEIYGDGR